MFDYSSFEFGSNGDVEFDKKYFNSPGSFPNNYDPMGRYEYVGYVDDEGFLDVGYNHVLAVAIIEALRIQLDLSKSHNPALSRFGDITRPIDEWPERYLKLAKNGEANIRKPKL